MWASDSDIPPAVNSSTRLLIASPIFLRGSSSEEVDSGGSGGSDIFRCLGGFGSGGGVKPESSSLDFSPKV